MGRLTDLIQRNRWDELEEVLDVDSWKNEQNMGSLVAELRRVDRLGRTPLHYACAKRHAPAHIVNLMLDRARYVESISRCDICGNTLVHAAATCGNADVVRVLLEKLARFSSLKIRHVNDVGLTPAMMAWKKYLDASFTMFGGGNSTGRVSPLVAENIQVLLRAKSMVDLSLADMERLRDLWDKTCVIAYSVYSKKMIYPVFAGRLWRPVHVLTAVGGQRNVQCPRIALWLAIRLFHDQLSQRDEYGNLPLHLALNSEELPEIPLLIEELACLGDSNTPVIEQLIRGYPAGARVRNKAGRLPLNIAIAEGKSWGQAILPLIHAAPEALQQRDPCTLLFPVLQAAASQRCRLTIVYELLRGGPDILLRCVDAESHAMDVG